MMIDHITYQVDDHALEHGNVEVFFSLLGFKEVEPNDRFEHGYKVRWFRRASEVDGPSSPWIPPFCPLIHLVSTGRTTSGVYLGLGHVCLTIGAERYRKACDSKFCARESGSGRAWMQYSTLRVEIRP